MTMHSRPRGEGGVHRRSRSGVDHPKTVWSDNPKGAAVCALDDVRLKLGSLGTGLREARCHDDHPTDARLRALVDGLEDRRGRDGDDRQTDRAWAIRDGSVPGRSVGRMRFHPRIDGTQRPSVAAGDEVLENLTANASTAATRSDDGDRGWSHD